jgi:equilibrative nucleoside transporter 1/2/3
MLPYGRYKFRLAGILTEALDSKLVGDYEEPLITSTVQDSNASTSSGPTRSTRASIISVETISIREVESVPWVKRNAFNLYCLSLFFLFVASFSVHPGVSAFVCSVQNPATSSPCISRPSAGRLFGDLFVPLLFVVFSVFDFLGRMLAGFGPWSRSAPNAMVLVIYSVLRFAAAGALLFSNVIAPTHWMLPRLIDNDYVFQGLVGLMGMTQGHLISTVLMHAPSTLPSNEQNRFGPVTSFAISAGSFLGSLVSVAIMTFLQTHAQ